MNTSIEYISQEKLAQLQEELSHLKNTRRGEIARELERTRALGDLSENAEYHQAREDQGWTEDRILQIEHIIRTSQVVSDKVKKSKDGLVAIGSTVVIVKKGERTPREVHIVGGEEADTTLGKISFHSPLGEALMGQKEGAEVSIQTPKGETVYKIKEVK